MSREAEGRAVWSRAPWTDVAEFRRSLDAFAGHDRYCKFLRTLNEWCRWPGRFRYWQEELLEQFAASIGVAPLTFMQVEPLLRTCGLHGVELECDPEELSHWCRGGGSPERMRAAAEMFPNTDCGPVLMGSEHGYPVRVGVWCCPACRTAMAQWEQQQPPQASEETRFVQWPHPVPQPETQWSDFDHDYFGFMQRAFDEGFRPRCDTDRAVEADSPSGRYALLIFRGVRNGWETCLVDKGHKVRLGPRYSLAETACVCIRPPFRHAARMALEWLRGRDLGSLLGDFTFVGGSPPGLQLRDDLEP